MSNVAVFTVRMQGNDRFRPKADSEVLDPSACSLSALSGDELPATNAVKIRLLF